MKCLCGIHGSFSLINDKNLLCILLEKCAGKMFLSVGRLVLFLVFTAEVAKGISAGARDDDAWEGGACCNTGMTAVQSIAHEAIFIKYNRFAVKQPFFLFHQLGVGLSEGVL